MSKNYGNGCWCYGHDRWRIRSIVITKLSRHWIKMLENHRGGWSHQGARWKYQEGKKGATPYKSLAASLSPNLTCTRPTEGALSQCPLISSLLCTQGWSRLGRQQAWGEVGAGGLSAEFAELHFSVSHRNSGGGGRCVRHWAGSCRPQAACRALRAALVLEACRVPSRRGSDATYFLPQMFW